MTQWTLSLNQKPIKRFNIKEGWNLTIGRGADADVIVDNTAISRKHASLELRNGQYIIADLESLNGTYVNGKKISKAEFVKDDDEIKLGKFSLAVSEESQQMEVLSYGAHPDTEDKTIIVNPKHFSAGKEKENSTRLPENYLELVQGQAAPNRLSLRGKNNIKIGKDLSCDMILTGMFVAGAQFYIVENNSKYRIIPRKSWAKTFLNGAKIKGEHLLKNGDIIKVRSTKIRFC